MTKRWNRTKLVLGEEALLKLQNSNVLIFGIGGVGSYTIEALARSGIGSLTIVDKDVVDETNINRQLVATVSTIGEPKVDIMKKRILDINPDCQVKSVSMFYLPETEEELDFSKYDYIVDAVDTVTAKIAIICRAKREGIPVISCMGTGNKLDPTMLEVEDLFKTSVCPLAKVMRNELKKREITDLKVVYSKEKPKKSEVIGSVPFVPSVAGLIIAGEVVKALVKEE